MIRFIIACLGVAALIMGIYEWGNIERPTFFYQSLGLLSISTIGIYNFLLKAKSKSSFTFAQFYLLTIPVKLIACLVYCILIVIKDRLGAQENIVFFLIGYILFTGLEVGFLLNKLRE